jgi:hypothetical protein
MKTICLIFCYFVVVFSLHADEIQDLLIDHGHPAYATVRRLLVNARDFDSFESAAAHGFVMCNPEPSLAPWSIMVLGHPNLPGYLIKKYPKKTTKEHILKNYQRRIIGAMTIADYIDAHRCTYLCVPGKWLYAFPNAKGEEDYCLIVEKIDIYAGGYWGGETAERYHAMRRDEMEELGRCLFDLRGCDAFLQNLPYTKGGKIAFIDTEHIGSCFGDFVLRIIPHLTVDMQKEARQLWWDLQLEEAEGRGYLQLENGRVQI